LAAAQGLLQELKTLAPLDGETALTIARALRVRQEPDRQRRQALAQFVLNTLALVAPGEHTAIDSRRLAALSRARGIAHELLDQRSEALTAYQEWIRYRPEDGDAQEAYATLLGKGLGQTVVQMPTSQPSQHDLAHTQTDGQRALKLWHQIERRSKPGGPRWRRARQARIVLLEQLGRHEQAQKLEQLTRILYP
jgi:tetratricopeptide (TPR) repeat protein